MSGENTVKTAARTFRKLINLSHNQRPCMDFFLRHKNWHPRGMPPSVFQTNRHLKRKSKSILIRRLLIPVQNTLSPDVQITDEQDQNENHHFEICNYPVSTLYQIVINNRPRHQIDCFNIEQQEDHCQQVKLNAKSFSGISDGILSAFVRHQLNVSGTILSCQARYDN